MSNGYENSTNLNLLLETSENSTQESISLNMTLNGTAVTESSDINFSIEGNYFTNQNFSYSVLGLTENPFSIVSNQGTDQNFSIEGFTSVEVNVSWLLNISYDQNFSVEGSTETSKNLSINSPHGTEEYLSINSKQFTVVNLSSNGSFNSNVNFSISSFSTSEINFSIESNYNTDTNFSIEGLENSNVNFSIEGFELVELDETLSINSSQNTNLNLSIVGLNFTAKNLSINPTPVTEIGLGVEGQASTFETLSINSPQFTEISFGTTGHLVQTVDLNLSANSLANSDINFSIEPGFPVTSEFLEESLSIQSSNNSDVKFLISGAKIRDTSINFSIEPKTNFELDENLGYNASTFTYKSLSIEGILLENLDQNFSINTNFNTNLNLGSEGIPETSINFGTLAFQIYDTNVNLGYSVVPKDNCSEFREFIRSVIGDNVFVDSDLQIFNELISSSQVYVYEKIKTFTSLRNIDTCPEEFLQYLQREISTFLPTSDIINTRQFIQESKDWYSGKGTEKSFQYISAITNTNLEIEEPSRLIFRLDSLKTFLDGDKIENTFNGSRLGRLRDGIKWSYYTYVVKIRPLDNLYLQDLITLIDLTNPAGVNYFLDIFFDSHIVVRNTSVNFLTFQDTYGKLEEGEHSLSDYSATTDAYQSTLDGPIKSIGYNLETSPI